MTEAASRVQELLERIASDSGVEAEVRVHEDEEGVIGEFVGSDVGLGYLIVIANNQIDTALGLAAIFLISLIGLLLYGAVLLAERLCTPWASGDGGLQASL